MWTALSVILLNLDSKQLELPSALLNAGSLNTSQTRSHTVVAGIWLVWCVFLYFPQATFLFVEKVELEFKAKEKIYLVLFLDTKDKVLEYRPRTTLKGQNSICEIFARI